LHELSQKVARASDRLTQDMDQPPSVSAIAQETNLSEDAVLEVMRTRSVFRPASLDGESDGPDPEGSIALDRRKVLAEKQAPEHMAVEDRIVIDEAVRKLKGLERRVIYYLFYKEFNQTEIARKLGISCNYVSHLVRTSLRRLRQMLTSEELREAHLRLKSAGARALLAEGAEGGSRFDDATGLLSTRAFRERLEQEVLRGARYAHPVALAILVLDGFHRFNEVHGFAASDGLLAAVAKLAQKNVRKVDVLARYGDAGFAILLPHTEARGGHVVAKRLLEEIPAIDLAGLTRKPVEVTACAGVAEYPHHGSSQEELLEAAVQALADARNEGPNTLRGAEKS
jgi:RNA polymerase sigma-B factor